MHTNLFHQIGLTDKDLKKVEIAVTMHSLTKELDKNDSAYLVTAILKDADALDRIRLGEHDLDIRYLRFPETKKMVLSAREIFFATDDRSFGSFEEMLNYISELNESFTKK